MPIYCYVCPNCRWTDEVIKPTNECTSDELCSQCGASMERDYVAETPGVVRGSTYNARPIHSDSLAIHPDQVAEHRRLYPDVPLDAACRPVFTSTKQRDKYLDARGVVKVSHNREF